MSKIAIISFFSGIVERGVETFAIELGGRLSEKNEVFIVQAGTLNKFGAQSSRLRINRIKPFSFKPKSSKNPFSKVYLDFGSLKILIFSVLASFKVIAEKPDIIIPLNGGWQTLIFRIISKVIGSKLLVSGHAGVGADDAWNLLMRPDAFVALTSAEEVWAKRLAPEVKVVQISNGVDLSHFNPKVVKKDVPLTKPIVICASALVPYKRVDLTIKAVAKTKELSLLILGDGELKGSIDSLGKRLLGDQYLRIVVPYQEIASYYRAGSVFSLASKTEAFGNTYLEAMACNLPVVTTSDESREQIIGDAGILTDPEDTATYSKDLLLAAKNNYRNKPYTRALNFSWNKVAKSYSHLIKTLQKND